MKVFRAVQLAALSFMVAACVVTAGPPPYRGPIDLDATVRPHVVTIIPLTSTSYSVHYVPGVVTETTIIASFQPTCAELGRVAIRGPAPTRVQTFRRGRGAAPDTLNVFTVVCR